jgi:hypothetical protein
LTNSGFALATRFDRADGMGFARVSGMKPERVRVEYRRYTLEDVVFALTMFGLFTCSAALLIAFA